LRKIQEKIDFDFIYGEVRDTYGDNGNVSIPPPVILKMMLLFTLYNVRSERELMDTIPLRLDWLWFLGYDLDSEVPNHSVLSKARSRWGVGAFRQFFERIVWQCVEAGLVNGRKIFMDSSLIDADASNNSVVDTGSFKIHLRGICEKLEGRLTEAQESTNRWRAYEKKNNRYISTTDPDAAIVNRGKPKLSYEVHRAVDGRSEVITAMETTAGDVNEVHMMVPLLESHHANTGRGAETVVADEGGESFSPCEAGHQDEAASDGALLCARDVVWF
jgi:transposase